MNTTEPDEFQLTMGLDHVLFADQTLFSEFIEMVSNGSCSYRFKIDPWNDEGIIDLPPPVVIALSGQLIGEAGPDSPEPRPLTNTERGATQNLITQLLSDLEKSWAPLIALQASNASPIEDEMQYAEVANPSDLVVIIGLTIRVGIVAGQMTLIYPYSSLDALPRRN